jgi:hypothetical protein
LILERLEPFCPLFTGKPNARISITMDIYRHVLESERREAAVDLFDATSPERTLRPIAVA